MRRLLLPVPSIDTSPRASCALLFRHLMSISPRYGLHTIDSAKSMGFAPKDHKKWGTTFYGFMGIDGLAAPVSGQLDCFTDL